MHVIGHQTIGENLHASAPATLSQEIDIERIIRRPEECRQSPVSPLRDMMRDPPGQQCVRCVAWTHPSTEGEETQEQKWNIAGFIRPPDYGGGENGVCPQFFQVIAVAISRL